jgi:hypothetical protein
MNQYTKRIMAMLLAICTLVSVAMPTVFATSTETITPEVGENTEIPENSLLI